MRTNTGDALVILSGLAGVFLAFFVLASMLPPAGMALVLVLILLFGLLMAVPAWALVNRLTSPRRDIAPDPRASIYAPAADYASPKPPQVIDVMRFDDNGQTRPLLAQPKPAPVQLRTRTAEGEHAQASAVHLLRFAGLRTPSRSEWSGKREAYGECAAWFTAHGMLSRTAAGGYAWGADYGDEERRCSFVQQFTEEAERSSAPARARAR